MKVRCHLCRKITADLRDASVAKGTVLICASCVAVHFKEREKRGDMTDSMPPFMSDFFRGLNK